MDPQDREDDLSASLRSMIATLEQFSKIIGTELEKVRAESKDSTEIREWEKLQLETLKLWERALAKTKQNGSRTRPKTHWIKRRPA